MFLKIGWHIWKPATCCLDYGKREAKSQPAVNHSWNIPLEDLTSEKKLIEKTKGKEAPYIQEDRYLKHMQENLFKVVLKRN